MCLGCGIRTLILSFRLGTQSFDVLAADHEDQHSERFDLSVLLNMLHHSLELGEFQIIDYNFVQPQRHKLLPSLNLIMEKSGFRASM